MKKYYGMTAEEIMALIEDARVDEDGDIIIPTENGSGCALYIDQTTGKVFGHCFCGWD